MLDGSHPVPGQRLRDLFLRAQEITEPNERRALLDEACAGDPELRRRVEELLLEHEYVGDFLQTPALGGERPAAGGVLAPGGTVLIPADLEQPGDRIGRYKLLQQIGEGGCGVVYMAEQEEPVRRRVALKVIKLGMDTKSVIARFEAERQALAMMDHPNIAKVLDAGATETGRPFFVMELVRGVKITDYCDQNHLPTEERLELFIRVAQAIQHAHQKGVIHRDIKPSNILVTLHDGVPVPKVIDFGIAKATQQRLTDKTLFTEFTAFIGTPAYMSPEQAEMSGLDIDTRSDVYSLGVLLYELLTGKTPFDAETLFRSGLDQCRRTIREEEPVRPSTRLATMIKSELTTTARQRQAEAVKLIHLLRGDLDWVVMKCLEKDRARRYETANGIALDVRRYLEGEPVLARPPSNVYRMQKLLRRHRGAFAAAAGLMVTLLIGAAVSSWLAIRATHAEHTAQAEQQLQSMLRQQAEHERERATQEKAAAALNEYVADINLAQKSLAADNYGRAVQLLNKHRPKPGEPDLRGFEWRYLWQLSKGDDHTPFPSQKGPVQSVAFSPGGDRFAVGTHDRVAIFDVRSHSEIGSLPKGKGAISMAFLPDGKTFITASSSSVRIWRTSDWSEEKSLPENSGPIALSRDGTRLATTVSRGDRERRQGPGWWMGWGMGREGVRIWDTATWQEVLVLPETSGPMAFSPNGQTLATDAKDGITLWSLNDGHSEIVLPNSTNVFARGGPWFRPDRSLSFSPDGKSVVAARNTLSERGVFVLSVWDAQSGEEKFMPQDPEHIEHTGAISSLAFSPDGSTLATASMDYSIRLWDFATRQWRSTLQGHLHEVWTVAFSPDGQNLVSGAKDGTVKLWSTRRQQKEDLLPGDWQPLAFSSDSRTLAARRGRGGAVAFLNLSTREPEQQLAGESDPSKFPPPPSSFSLSADLATTAQGLREGTVRIRNLRNGSFSVLKVASCPLDLVALSPNGHKLITGGHEDPLRCWDLAAGTNILVGTEARQVLFSPDGRTLAAFQRGNNVELWDVQSHSFHTNLVLDSAAPGPGPVAAFSPDSRTLALACFDDVIRLWDVASGRLLGACTGHKQAVFSVAFSADGKTLASTSDDSTLKLWNVATQQELLTIRRLGGTLRDLTFSPDGRWLVGGGGFFGQGGGLRFYRAPLLSETDLGAGEAERGQ